MLTRAEIASFHRDGFLVMPGIVQGTELARLQAVTAEVIAEGMAGRGKQHLYQQREDGSQVYWRSEAMWQRHAAFRAVAVHPTLLENIGQCLGHAFFPWNDSLVVKTPGGEGVGWHQDPPFGEPARLVPNPMPNFTTDIYLDDSDEGNGCLWAIPGHHLVGHVRLEDRSQEDLFTRCGAVPVRMRAGDVLFHSLSTPHGSRPNRSMRQRRTFYIHYLCTESIDSCAYTQWGKMAWGAEKRAQLAAMDADRQALGLGAGFDDHLAVADAGIEIRNRPDWAMTPRNHWQQLAEAIPEERRASLRGLAPDLSPAPALQAVPA